MKINSTTVVRVTKTEFETQDGVVHQMPIELDSEISVVEFQKIYDEWLRTFQQKELLVENTNE